MNTVPNIEAELTDVRKQRVKEALNQSFSDPRLLQHFDAILSRQAQVEAHRTNPAAPLVPVIPAEVARNYKIQTGTGNDTLTIHGAVDGTLAPNTIQQSWGALNTVIDEWLAEYPDNEREVMRQRFYYLLHDEIKSVLETKNTDYQTKLNAVNNATDTFYNDFNRSRAEILTNLNVVANGSNLTSTFPGPNIADASLVGLITFLNAQNRDSVQLPTFSGQFTTAHSDAIRYLRTFNYRPASPGPPPRANDQPRIDALTIVTNSGIAVNSQYVNFENACRVHLTDHAGNRLGSVPELRERSELLTELSGGLSRLATEEVMDRGQRYRNLQIQENAQFTICPGVPPRTLPATFYHPRKSAVGTNTYTRGTAFSVADYGTYFQWAQANRTEVTEAQATSLNQCSADLVNQINVGLGPQITALQTQLAAGTLTSYEVKTQVRGLINRYFRHTVAGADGVLTGMGLAPFVSTQAQMDVVANILRWHFNVSDQTGLVNGLSNHIIYRLNLPDAAEQAKNAQGNRESYAETAYRHNILRDDTELIENRNNYLNSVRAQIYEQLREKYSSKDLTNPETQQEFSAELIKLVMQARLDTLNETLKHRQRNWLTRIKEYWSDTNGASLAITAGLAVTAIASGIYLDPTIITPVTTAIKSLWGSGTALIAAAAPKTGAGLAKAIGLGATFFAGQRITQSLGDALAYKMPWSAARYRSKREVMGTTDANSNSANGLGDINAATGTYNFNDVHEALAAQMAFAEKQGLNYATGEAEGINPIIGSKNKRKLSTSQHLWAREKQGMGAVVKHRLNQVATNPAIPTNEKNNAMIVNALNSLYAPGAIEDNFLTEVENRRAGRKTVSAVKLFTSVGAGAGLGYAFNVRF